MRAFARKTSKGCIRCILTDKHSTHHHAETQVQSKLKNGIEHLHNIMRKDMRDLKLIKRMLLKRNSALGNEAGDTQSLVVVP
jgi:hypothetical protein